ncbi:MAG: hypothetical protein B6U72_03870 [Candidatus Altiarchaeales archaeon ex4484_2]|nr:MAG: hypothetical protein B6U72_03870 [Candidatus Altiarchaeales archaeon ex4484_2]
MKESQTIEFKKSLAERKEILETISAFANSKGGQIFIGIDENKDGSMKEVVGVKIKGREIENLGNEIKQNTDPVIFPSIEVEKIKGKDVLVIEVKENQLKPVFAKIDKIPIAFKRVGRTNQKIDVNELRRIISEGKEFLWDSQICEEATLRDINEKTVREFLRKARFERRLEIDPSISVEEALRRLNLIKDKKLTNAAILLFGKNPQRSFLQAEIRCARFKGTEPLEFIDMKVFGGNIIDQREDAVEFVKEHIKLHAKIVGTERVETWEYPIEAIREAITNAICHRNYEIQSNTQVRIFDDRIEVWGCGPLPEPLTVEDLKKKHDSILRNPLIGKCFFLIRFIEQWGTGTNRIIRECLDHDLLEPLFEEIAKSLVITFRKYVISEDTLEQLNKRQKKTIGYLKIHKKITRSEYVKIIGCSERTAFRDLTGLLKKGIVKRKGKSKQTYYELT